MPDNLRLGAVYAVAAAAAFAVMAACVKTASAATGSETVVFFRSAVGLLILLPWLFRHGASAVRTRRLGGHLWRAGFGISAMYSFFFAIAHLNLAEAVLLTYSTPLFIPFIAWLWLRETPPVIVFPSIVLGFAGIGLVVKPVAGFVTTASVVGLLSAVCAAAAWVSIRRIADTEPATRIVFYFSALSTAVSAVPLLWAWRIPAGEIWLWLAATGIFATAGQFCLTRAYSLTAAARLGPFMYVSVIFAGLLGWAFWGEQPDGYSMLGMALVIASCVLAGWRRA